MELSYSLPNYSLSCKELLLFWCVSPYAKRHYGLGEYYQSNFHKSVAILEYTPLIGTIASIVELIFVKINDYFAFMGLRFDSPDVDAEIEDRIMRIVLKNIPDFNDLTPMEKFNKLIKASKKYTIPDKVEEWDNKKFIKAHDKKMRLLWKFSKVADQIVDEIAQKELEEGEDIKTRRSKIYGTQKYHHLYGAFFELPAAYQEARKFTIARFRNKRGEITATKSLNNTNVIVWKYRSRVFYREGTRQFFWRTLFNEFCRRERDLYDYDSFIINEESATEQNDKRFELNSIEDKGKLKFTNIPSS